MSIESGMIDKPRGWYKPRILIVLSCGIGMYFSIGVVLLYSFGALVGMIAADTRWDRTQLAGLSTPVAVALAVMSPITGVLTDRFGPRKVLIVSAMTMAAGFAGIAIWSETFAQFAIGMIVAAVLGGAQSGVPYTHVIAGWFGARRGLALGVMLAFVGVGIATVPPVLTLVATSWGWRAAFFFAASVALTTTLPVAVFLVKDPTPASAGGERHGSSLKEAVAHSSFWLLLGAFFFNYLAAAGGSISLPIVSTDQGASRVQGALALSIVGLALIGGRLSFGALVDRIPATPLTIAAFLTPALGHTVLAHSRGTVAMYASAVLFGLASGAEGDAVGYLIAQRFGMRSFGKIYGIQYFALTVGAGCGPAILNVLAVHGSRYDSAFTIMSALGLLGPLFLLMEWRISSRESRNFSRYAPLEGPFTEIHSV